MSTELSAEKVAAFAAQFEVERLLSPLRLPVLLIVGLPGAGELLRSCNGMEHDGTRESFRAAAMAERARSKLTDQQHPTNLEKN